MPRERLCKVCRAWHDMDTPWPAECLPPPKPRSAFPVPMVNRDCMPLTQSMVDGRWYDSKSSIRAHYRDAKVIEVGNEVQRVPPPPQPKSNKPAVRDALQKAGVWDDLPA